MRSIFLNLFVLTSILLIGCNNQNEDKSQGFHITGHLKGAENGVKVALTDDMQTLNSLDSTLVKDESFSLKGNVDNPQKVYLIIYKDTSNIDYAENTFITPFYIENSDIEFTANIDSLPTLYWKEGSEKLPLPKVLGSQTEDLNRTLNNKLSKINSEWRDLDTQYTEIFHKPSLTGDFSNTEEAIQVVYQMDSLNNEAKKIKIDFIKENPKSPVSVDLLSSLINGMELGVTVEEGEELIKDLKLFHKDNNIFNDIENQFNILKNTAEGQHYIDIEIENHKGKIVKLSDYLSKEKYTLVEFWASWCGPCRGEIPHLKHTYQEYKNKNFDIISISLDDKKEDWEKVLEKENMPWEQFIAPNGSESDFLETYGISGIPYSLLINPEGVIIAKSLTGAKLEAELEKIHN